MPERPRPPGLPGPGGPDLAALPLPAALSGPAGVRTLRAVPFAAPAGFRPLELDLHLPPGAGPWPVVVFVHGGGWQVGSRTSFGPVLDRLDPHPFQRLAGAGFAVATVDYRLSGEAVFPAQLDDVVAAVGFLARRGAEAGLDLSRTVLWGESAGGHLAALTGLHLSRQPAGTSGGAAVVGVVDWYGPSDLPEMHADALPGAVADPDDPASRESLLLGTALPLAGPLAVAASPARQVHPGAPPFHLAHGTADRFVPPRQSERLRDALAAHGVPADLLPVPGADHLWMGAGRPDEILDAALAFARKVTAG